MRPGLGECMGKTAMAETTEICKRDFQSQFQMPPDPSSRSQVPQPSPLLCLSALWGKSAANTKGLQSRQA